MRLRIKSIAIAALLARCAAAETGWEQVLASVNLNGDPRIHMAAAGEPACADWKSKIERGAVLILTGESPLAFLVGFSAVETGDRGHQLARCARAQDAHRTRTSS